MHTLSHNLLPDVAKKLAALLPTLRQSSGYMLRLNSFCFLGALGELYRRETGHPVWFGFDAEAFARGTNIVGGVNARMGEMIRRVWLVKDIGDAPVRAQPLQKFG